MPTRPPFSLRWTMLALVVGAAACADQPTAPAGPRLPGPAASASAASQKPTLVPNHVRYRDQGQQPATGRSGSAALTALALVGRDGTTELEVASSRADAPEIPAGRLEQVQVKAFAADGSPIVTLTEHVSADGPRVTLVYPGFAPGTLLQVQAVVRGIDGERADVVSVTERVKRRPNLAVELHAPGQAPVGVPTIVSATVRETSGDVGARADCVLYVDGQPADRANGIWVDAGDAVTCAFTLEFATPGTRRLEVRLERVRPRDDDPSDNADSATLEVVGGERLSHTVTVSQARVESRWSMLHRWSYGDFQRGEAADSGTSSSLHQAVSIQAFTADSVTLSNTRVEIEEETSGTPIYAGSFLLFDGTTEGPCDTRFDGAAGANVFVCLDESTGWTMLRYERFAGTSVYHSAGYSRVWDPRTGDEQVYHYNRTEEQSFGFPVPFGSDYAFRLRLLDGVRTFFAGNVVPLEETTETSVFPYQCVVSEFSVFRDEFCSEEETVSRIIFAFGGEFL